MPRPSLARSVLKPCARQALILKPRAKRSAPASLARSVLKPCALSRLCHLIMSSRRDRERERGEEERKRDGERERG